MTYYILVCGSTTFNDYPRLERVLQDEIPLALQRCPIGETITIAIVHGDAPGADKLADRYAKEYKLLPIPFRANWKRFDRRAGPIRNSEMATFLKGKLPYVSAIAFWNGVSPGTEDMLEKISKILRIPVRREYF